MGCTDRAVARIFWPGSPPLPMCQKHTNGARTVSAAMGFVEIRIEEAPADG